MAILWEVFRVGAFAAGVLLLFYTLFSYEDEDKKLNKKINNWFVDAWVSLEDSNESSAQRIAAFLRKLLGGLNNLFARLYGERLVSLRSIAVGACYVTAGFAIWNWMTEEEPTISTHLRSIFFIAIPISAPIFRRNWPSYIIGVLSTLTFTATMIVSPVKHNYISAILVLAVMIFDGLLIALIRNCFLRAAVAPTLRGVLLLILTGTAVAPLYLLAVSSVGLIEPERGMNVGENLLFGIQRIAAFNAVPTLTSLSFLVILVVGVQFRIAYALLPRFIYIPLKFKLLDNRKTTMGLAIALMGVSIPGAVGIMEKAAKVMGLG